MMASLSIERLRELISPEGITKVSTLDRVLEDLFNEKIEFKVREDFIRCLQVTVENYVTDLLNALMKLEEVQAVINTLKDKYKDNPQLFIYQHEILCVGSFYEGTKNTFPDEFDYVMILLTARRLINVKQRRLSVFRYIRENNYFSTNILEKISDFIASNIKDLSDYAIKVHENYLFDFEYKSVERVGPACKLCFTLIKKVPEIFEGDTVNIHVDVTPAIKVKDLYLPLYVETICSLKCFCDEILKLGSFIVVQKSSTRLSFTETELLFVKNCLSSRHKRAYRILKYLMNGDLEESKLRKLNKYKLVYFKFSSYVLKILMINHHYKCQKNEQMWTESACILDVLKELQGCIIDETIVKIPSIEPNVFLTICLGEIPVQCFANGLSEIINTFESLSQLSANVCPGTAIVPISKRIYIFLWTLDEKEKAQAKRTRIVKRI